MLHTNKAFNTASARHALLMMVAGFSLVLGGCASQSASSKVASTTIAEYYPACYEPVQHLRGTDADVSHSTATGAVVGGLLGAAAGALTGDRDKMARNVAIGAVGGAVAGGAVGYYTEKQKQITDDKARIASYGTDIDKSTGDIDRNVAYAQASQSCYQQEFANLLNMRKAKTISDDEGRKRLAEIVSGLKESNALLVAANGRAGTDADSYTQAYEKDLQITGVQRAQVVTVANNDTVPVKAKIPAKKLPKVPQEAVATEKTLQKNTASRNQGQTVANNGQALVQTFCTDPDLGNWADKTCAKPS